METVVSTGMVREAFLMQLLQAAQGLLAEKHEGEFVSLSKESRDLLAARYGAAFDSWVESLIELGRLDALRGV